MKMAAVVSSTKPQVKHVEAVIIGITGWIQYEFAWYFWGSQYRIAEYRTGEIISEAATLDEAAWLAKRRLDIGYTDISEIHSICIERNDPKKYGYKD